MRIEVNFAKMLKELYKDLTDKQLHVLRLRLECKTNEEISKTVGLTPASLALYMIKIRDVLGIELKDSTYVSYIQLGMVCYERGYVVITEEGKE